MPLSGPVVKSRNVSWLVVQAVGIDASRIRITAVREEGPLRWLALGSFRFVCQNATIKLYTSKSASMTQDFNKLVPNSRSIIQQGAQ